MFGNVPQWCDGRLPPGLPHGPLRLPCRGQWWGLLLDCRPPCQHHRQLGRDGVCRPETCHLPAGGGRGRRCRRLQSALLQLCHQGGNSDLQSICLYREFLGELHGSHCWSHCRTSPGNCCSEKLQNGKLGEISLVVQSGRTELALRNRNNMESGCDTSNLMTTSFDARNSIIVKIIDDSIN